MQYNTMIPGFAMFDMDRIRIVGGNQKVRYWAQLFTINLYLIEVYCSAIMLLKLNSKLIYCLGPMINY